MFKLAQKKKEEQEKKELAEKPGYMSNRYPLGVNY